MEFTGERLVPTAEGFDELFLEHAARYAFAASSVKGKRVLDAGCGCGYGAYHMARGGAAAVLGIDRSNEAIAYAGERFRAANLAWAVADVASTGLAPSSFDAIVAFEVFEHLQEPARLLDEAKRLLRPGGFLLVSTPNAATYVAGGPDGKNPFHYREYSPGEFAGLLRSRFGSVRLFAQAPLAGLAILPVGDPDPEKTVLGADIRPLGKPADSIWAEPRPIAASAEGSAFLVAIAAVEADASLPEVRPALFTGEADLAAGADRWSRAARETNDTLDRMEKELEGRTTWVRSLEKEIAERDSTIQRMQKEFDERSAWALDLDRKVREQARLIQRLCAAAPNAARAGASEVSTKREGADR